MSIVTPPRSATSLWWLPLTLGVVNIVVGLIAIFWPEVSLAVVGVLFGIQLLIAGVLRLAQVIFTREGETTERVITAAVGVLFLFVGLLCLQNVMQTIKVLALLVGLVWVIGGAVGVIGALASGPPSRWTGVTLWELVVGVVSVLAGVVVLIYPKESVTALAVLLGIWLLVIGIVTVAGAFRLRSLATA
jgi:uncharacterized membrane protein HdeD (DUF308 family)